MVEELIGELREIEGEGVRAIGAADSAAALEALRVEYLGRKGAPDRPCCGVWASSRPTSAPQVGAEANRVKDALSALVDERAASLAPAEGAGPRVDLTLPGRHRWTGGLHPVTQVVDEICEIFRDLGFTRVAGPEVETVEYNFVKLNTPLDHPAADMHDTFYLTEGVCCAPTPRRRRRT
jgi:phenylalanyl-tRNA synthetase alpha chain